MSRSTASLLGPVPGGLPLLRTDRPFSRLRTVTLGLLAAVALAAGGAVAPVAAAAAEEVPLSQGKQVTSSSAENADYTPASAAVDGNLGTRWASAQTDAQWLQVDLAAVATLDRVVLRWEAAYGKAFRIEVSDDAMTWRTAATVTDGVGGTQTVALSGTGRYVRFAGVTRGTGYGYSLWEMQVFGTTGGGGGGGGTGTCTTTNVAQGGTATASSAEGAGTSAAAAVDGSTGTRWSSAFSDAQWWQVDLGQTRSLCGLELVWEGAYGTAFEVQVSADGSSWATVKTVVGGTGGTQRLDVSGTGRYLRVKLNQRATGYGYSLWEVRAFALGGDGGGGGTDCASGPADGAVRITGSAPTWCLLVNGAPFTVKGLTWGPAVTEFEKYAPDLKAMGVNTIRTWGTDASSKALFDVAAKHGIRVMAGFWLGPGGGPGSGGCPNYRTDAAYKSAVMNDITTWTTAYKDNPGVLMWNVGNESILGLGSCYSGAELEAQRNAYASFVNEAAQAIHGIDPNHPVTSTDAWTGAWPYLKANAPDLDLYGLNSYGAVCDTKATWVAGGYDKPYIITEGGPAGEWEVPDDVNGVPDQGTDVQNAAGYTKAWECIQGHAGVALGATLFHFGTEGDFGGIWFNVAPGGNRRLSYYAVARAYGGPAAAPATNTPPVFSSMTVAGPTAVVAGSMFTVNAAASDPNGDPITYTVLLNSKYVNNAGGLAATPFTRNGTSFTVQAPQTLGVWKVYVFAEDGRGNVGVETRSFRVVPPAVAGTNIAQGRPASASSFDPWNGNFTAGQATDGDYSTRWSSEWSDDQWIQVDLGSVRSFDRVQLVWEGAYGRGYRIQTSTDGAIWTTVSTVTDGDGNVDTLEVAGSAQLVRVQGTQRGTGFGYSLYELAVYDS